MKQNLSLPLVIVAPWRVMADSTMNSRQHANQSHRNGWAIPESRMTAGAEPGTGGSCARKDKRNTQEGDEPIRVVSNPNQAGTNCILLLSLRGRWSGQTESVLSPITLQAAEGHSRTGGSIRVSSNPPRPSDCTTPAARALASTHCYSSSLHSCGLCMPHEQARVIPVGKLGSLVRSVNLPLARSNEA